MSLRPAREGDGKGTINPWLIAPLVALAAFMEVLDISIANVSLQHIAGDLSAGQDESTWILTSYLVTNAVILPVSGWLSSVMGRTRFFVACIIGFSISSLACGLAPTLGLLIVFRAIQGLTGGGLQPTAQAILADSFPPRQRGMAFALYGMAVVFAPAIGPTLGGWITDQFSWRWVFLLNVPIGVVLTMLVTALLQDPPAYTAARLERRRQGAKVDYIGFSLLAVGLGFLQIVLDKGEQEAWFASSFIFWLSVFSLLSLISFVLWELGQKHPIVELRLLFERNFGVANLLMFLLGFILLGSTVLLPELVQRLFGYTATEAGLVITPGGVSIILVMPIVGRLVSVVDSRYLIALGLVICSFALFHMADFSLETDYRTFVWARIYQAFGLSLLFIPINTAAYRFIPATMSSEASALINVARNLGGSFGISLVTTYLSRFGQVHQTTLVAHATPFDAPYRDMMNGLALSFVAQGATAAEASAKALGSIYAIVQKQALLLAFLDDFQMLGIVFLAVLPFVFIMKGGLPGHGPGPAAH
ncbi:DHA2 family efflux MFS transporter permease subunit [Telmatospirillum siberiense]|uniref:EmrB/QacA family drug resistance transporter n=1 Tax=Telmatospirillum siberiense TaxID=382514 RepID=A0A2N3PSG9_9PROT|nr:DHA2 family efflux MFS transporter permease subunit [Telmatospirillum siberiense]PKU23342.1 EmrB/QacA family drug resistance transporter [Telmatospirillum siberiense]